MSILSEEKFREIEQQYFLEANNGDITAYRKIGDLYYNGCSGSEKNHQRAYPYWKKAADAGDATAAGLIGIRLFLGEYGKDREGEAIPYLLTASEAGTNGSTPQLLLGRAYDYGMGIKKNKELAESYYRTAALKNDAQAQYFLSKILYERNNIDDSIHWACRSHLNGNKNATELLNQFVSLSEKYRGVIERNIEIIKGKGFNTEVTGNTSMESGGCYIATAVYGSYDAPEVMILRRFRDEDLLTNWPGRLFVKVYYALSPFVANKLKNAEKLNSVVRNILDTFVQYLLNKQDK